MQEEFDALRYIYEEEYEVNHTTESALHHMYANFWRQKGSLSWLDNNLEVPIIVYDLIIEEEKPRTADEGKSFDEGIFLVEEFTP